MRIDLLTTAPQTRALWKHEVGPSIVGAGEWTRTTDPRITNALLCQLSYTGFTAITAGRGVYPRNHFATIKSVSHLLSVGVGQQFRDQAMGNLPALTSSAAASSWRLTDSS